MKHLLIFEDFSELLIVEKNIPTNKKAEATARQENKGKKKKVNENIALSNSAARIYIDDDEAEMFTTDPVLQKLISDEKVSLLTPELWFESEDTNTINILRDYFPDVDFDFSDED